MSKLIRVVVMTTALMTCLAGLAGSAGAVTWHNSGDTAFTAGGGAGTFSVTGVSFACTGSAMTGTSPGTSTVGNVYTAATGSFHYNGCTITGIATTWDCGYTMTLSLQHALPRAVSTGNMDVLCSIQQFGAEICKVEGSTPITYTNPTAPSTPGSIQLLHSSTLRTTNGVAGSCPLGVGEPSTMTTHSFSIATATGGPTPHLGPVITRTA